MENRKLSLSSEDDNRAHKWRCRKWKKLQGLGMRALQGKTMGISSAKGWCHQISNKENKYIIHTGSYFL